MSEDYRSIMKDGLWEQNVVFSQMLALCPTMAVTTSGTNGLGMGLATTAVLVVSNILVSMIRHTVSSQVRIPVFVVLIATLVTVVDMAMNAGTKATIAARIAAVSTTGSAIYQLYSSIHKAIAPMPTIATRKYMT